MKYSEVLEKVNRGEGLTVTEIKIYQKHNQPIEQVYRKYGRLKLKYLEEKGIDWLIADLPTYLHNVDKEADDLYETMYNKLSKNEQYKRTGNYLEDIRRENAIKILIEEEILNEIVYVD